MDKNKLIKEVINITNHYLLTQYKILNLSDCIDDHRQIIKYEKALSNLDLDERVLFKKEFLDIRDKNWWKKHYSKNVFYTLKVSACVHFLELLSYV